MDNHNPEFLTFTDEEDWETCTDLQHRTEESQSKAICQYWLLPAQ